MSWQPTVAWSRRKELNALEAVSERVIVISDRHFGDVGSMELQIRTA